MSGPRRSSRLSYGRWGEPSPKWDIFSIRLFRYLGRTVDIESISLFISYSHIDEPMRLELESFLKPLMRDNLKTGEKRLISGLAGSLGRRAQAGCRKSTTRGAAAPAQSG